MMHDMLMQKVFFFWGTYQSLL